MHRALRGSRMVTVAGGEGHGVYGAGSRADEVANTYLTTGRLPARDLTCRTPGEPPTRRLPARGPRARPWPPRRTGPTRPGRVSPPRAPRRNRPRRRPPRRLPPG
ncbi:alpha/beta hydrolase [Streptomyces halstedii]|uniref:alpha/beta hydrolase n=1 Tax=Streptomyces halstedii TaxID=1944 RepID=UPI003F4CEC93